MFRKKQDVAERSRSLLKNSAAKKIKAEIVSALPLLTKEIIDELMPNKDGIEVVKLATRALVYFHVPTKTPLFFDSDGRNNLFPTVYALWRVGQLASTTPGAAAAAAGGGAAATAAGNEAGRCCPPLVVHPPVSKFLLNGADVMLPAGVVVRDLASVDYVMGERRCVMSSGNPEPYAVGEMIKDREGVVHGGMTGKGLKVVHCYLDFLWQMGPQTLPNEGFRPDGVYRLPSAGTPISGQEELVDDGEVADDWEDLSDPAAAAGAAGGGGSGGGSDEKPAAAVEGLGLEGVSLEDAGGEGEEQEGEAVEVVSERLYAAFLNGLKKGLKDAQLPMLVSTFYSSVLLPSRPPGTSIDVKKTSYRKISNFLQEMEGRGLVTLEVTKGVQSLVGVNRAHPDLRAFKATTVTAAAQAAADAAALAAAEAGGGGATATAAAGDGETSLKAFELFKLSHNIKKMLGSDAASARGKFGEYLTPAEARDVLFGYIRAEGLDHPTDKSLVVLNGPLCDNLYKPMNKKAARVEYPTEAKKAELPRRFLDRLQLHHAILLPGNPHPFVGRGGIPSVSIEVEKRQGNRHATKVRGLEAYGIDPSTLGRQVQKRFACSTAAQPAPGTNGKYQELMLQGHLASELEDLLSEEMGIPRRFLTTGFSKGAKPRKAR
ncbi:unnamed protein product [Ectocarpus sp. 6 AP-2014]